MSGRLQALVWIAGGCVVGLVMGVVVWTLAGPDAPDVSPGSPTPSTSETATVPSPSLSVPSGPLPPTRSGTWRGRQGVVVAQCTGSSVSVVSAYAADGWGYSVDENGPDLARVTFTRDSALLVQVELGAGCLSGRPVFSTAAIR